MEVIHELPVERRAEKNGKGEEQKKVSEWGEVQKEWEVEHNAWVVGVR